MEDKKKPQARATPPKGPHTCPKGRFHYEPYNVVDGVCYNCEGDEAARQARLEEKGVFLR